MVKERNTLIGLWGTLAVLALIAAPMAAQTPQTTKEKTTGAPTVTTEEMRGEVVKVEGNTLVVKMESGELRTFSNVPDSRKALIDGKQVGVRDLQPGTKLTATVTTTATPVTVRTTTVGTGRVFFVSGNNVILTLPNGENKQYTVKPDYKFIVSGKPATVRELRQGMTVSAEKIVEEPTVEIATNTEVVGQAPASGRAAAAAPARAAAPGAAPARAAAAPGAAPVPASASPGTLPKTGGPVPLMGLLGLLFASGSVALRRFRRS